MKLVSLVLVGLTLVLGGCSDSASSSVTLMGSGSTGSAAKLLAATDPSSLTLKVYKFAVSASADCSSPVTVYETTTPEYVDFLDTITIGSGSVADGTYPCVMFEFSDRIKFTPSATGTHCVAGEEETLEVCRSEGAVQFQLIDGTIGTCDDTEQRVAMYISTNSASTGGGDSNAFMPPTSAGDASHGIQLTGAFTVAGASVATFVVDGSEKVEDTSSCDMQPPDFSFTAE